MLNRMVVRRECDGLKRLRDDMVQSSKAMKSEGSGM